MTHPRLVSLGFATALLIISLGCGGMGKPSIQGSGVAATEPRDVGEFHNVRVNGSARVNIQIGDKRSVTVTADDNVLPVIETEVKGDTLVISSKESFSTRMGVTVAITLPELSGVEINGSGDIDVKDLRASKFAAIIRGSGDVSVTGTADELSAEIQGSGDLKLGNLAAKRASVSVAGSGDGTVNVSEALSVSVAGSGDIRYKGSPPKVEKSIAGSGSVKPVG